MSSLKKFVGDYAYSYIKNIAVDADKIRKALVTPQNARNVFSGLDEFQIKSICTEISGTNTFGTIRETTQEEIIEDFNKAGYDTVIFDDEEKIAEYKKEINSYITKKAKISGELSPAGSYKKQLIEERSGYENELNNNSEYVKADASGVISYRIDGLEDTFKTDDFSNISTEMLKNLNLKTAQIISTSNTEAKIINNYKCYIACTTDSEQAKNVEVGSTKVKLRISGTDEVSTKLVHKKQEDDGNVVLVFEINKDVEKLISYRKVSVDIIWWSDTGLKVPNDAIIEEDGKSYVTRVRAGYETKILVKVLKQNEKYAVVENYTVDELKELGYSSTEINSRSKIALYDEIKLNN